MTDWIDFAIYALFLFMLWIWFPAKIWKFWSMSASERNPDWLAEHPGYARKLSDSRWCLWPAFFIGGLSLLAIALIQTDIWPFDFLAAGPHSLRVWQVTNMSVAGFIAYLVVMISVMRSRRLGIPLAPRRQATLEIRSVDRLIPRWVLVAIYAVAAINVAGYIAIGASGLYSGPARTYWIFLATMLLVIGIFSLLVRGAVRRPPNRIDYAVGPVNRRAGIWILLGVMCLILAGTDFILYESSTHMPVLDGRVDRLMFIVVELLVFASIAYLFRRIRSRMASAPGGITPSGML